MIRGAMASTRSLTGTLASTRGGTGTPWYRVGGAPLPIAVYQPKGAASQAASYVNLVNPGTFDLALGVAPGWSEVLGWGFSGTQYLRTGIIPGSGYSYAIRFSDVPATNGLHIMASFSNVGSTQMRLTPYAGGSTIYVNGGSLNVADNGTLPAGVLGMAGNTAYKNGVSQGTMGAWSGTATREIYIGARNNQGTADGLFIGSIQAAAVWNASADHAVWMPEVMAAVMAL